MTAGGFGDRADQNLDIFIFEHTRWISYDSINGLIC